MADSRRQSLDFKPLVDTFLRLPRPFQVGLVVVCVVGVLVYFAATFHKRADSPTPSAQNAESGQLTPVNAELTDGAREVFFCFWNVENLFDDKHDKRRSVDAVFDAGFADNAELRQLKYDHLATALLKMNDGKGPDLLACVELESVRALELLQGTLNSKITDPKLKYVSYAMKEVDAGRHIAPGVLSRLPLSQQRTKLLAPRLRILETHLIVNNFDLSIVASHWTSKLKQADGGSGEEGREKYARTISAFHKQLVEQTPDADFLLCGDFNDTPDSEEVTQTLQATDDVSKVKASTNPPLLLDLLAGKAPDKYGTLYYGKPVIYDHICVSRGMLDDAAWSCDPTSIQTFIDGLRRPGATRREPWRFDSPEKKLRDADRGYSDHFPVTVKLKVRAAKNAQN